MRDIKFRAWHEQNKTMVNFCNNKLCNDEFQRRFLCRIMRGDFGDVLMQYTDLKDNYGVEIYEGDIVSVSGIKGSFEVELEGLRGVILLDNILVNSYLDFVKEGRKITVIGNKYENPELLEKLR